MMKQVSKHELKQDFQDRMESHSYVFIGYVVLTLKGSILKPRESFADKKKRVFEQGEIL